jgi:hypothetical protein
MRNFVTATVKHLKEQTVGCVSLFEAQLLELLLMHSDNAAQHFKSSKSLHWLSKQLRDMGFRSVLWDFGPPGHGKAKPPPFPLCQPPTPLLCPLYSVSL